MGEVVNWDGLAEKALGFYNIAIRSTDDEQTSDTQSLVLQCAKQIEASSILPGREPGSLLLPVIRFLSEKQVQVRQLAVGLGEPFLLFVVGMGKVGKSTLLNALVGRKVADVDALPKTWKIDIYEAVDRSGVRVRYRNGDVRDLTIQEAKKLLAEEEGKIERSWDKVDEEFSKRAVRLTSTEAKEELKQMLQKEFLYVSYVAEVAWPCPSGGLLKDFRLVDTPGIMQTRSDQSDSRTDIRDYYHKADGVLWLLDATTNSGQGSRLALETLDKAKAMLGGRTGNMIGVLNRVDLVSSDDVNRIIRDIEAKYGQYFRAVVPVSAKKAWDALNTRNDVLLEVSGLPGLRDAIERHFRRQASRLQVASKLTAIDARLAECLDGLRSYHKRFREDSGRYAQITATAEMAFKRLIEEYKGKTVALITEYKDAAERRIDSRSEEALKMEGDNAKQHFITESILGFSGLEQQLKGLALSLEEAITKEVRFQRDKVMFSEYRHLRLQDPSVVDLSSASVDFSFSSEYTVDGGFVNAVIGGLGLAVLGPAGLLIGWLSHATGIGKWIALQIKLPSFKLELKEQVGNIGKTIDEKVQAMLDEQVEQALQHVWSVRDATFAQIHCTLGEMDNLTRALDKAESNMLVCMREVDTVRKRTFGDMLVRRLKRAST